MFEFCSDPKALEGTRWLVCYLTTGGHVSFYLSFGTVLLALALAAPAALAFGLGGALAARSRILPLRWVGMAYTAIVRGVPDIVFFLFFVVALDQGLEWTRHQVLCPNWEEPIRQGANFLVCDQARLPRSNAPQWVHEIYGFALAIFTYAIVFGAFAANVLSGAIRSVPRAQVETAEAYGMTPRQAFRRVVMPQMWGYALPGLSNIWMILVKATPLLFLLGVKDVVYWAKELGGAKGPIYNYPHPDWRLWYFLGLLVFYLLVTRVSESVLARISARLSHGQATAEGERMRRAEVTA